MLVEILYYVLSFVLSYGIAIIIIVIVGILAIYLAHKAIRGGNRLPDKES